MLARTAAVSTLLLALACGSAPEPESPAPEPEEAAAALPPPALSEGMAARSPGARLELVAGSGHMAPLEKPELVNDALRSFWVG